MSTQSSTQSPRVPPELELEDEIDLSRWVDALRRRRWLLAAVTGSVLLIALLLYVITPKTYRATTTIQINRNTTTVVSMEDVLGRDNYWDAQSFYPTQYKLLESRGMAERVVKNLRLAENSAFNPPGRKALAGGAADAKPTAADDARMLGNLAQRLKAGLTVNPVRNTRLVEISYVAPDRQLAAQVANGVADAYIDWGIETRTETMGRASSFIASQIEEVKREIADKEAQLQAYSQRSDIVALDPNSNVVLQRLEALNQDYTAAVSARIEKEAKFNEVTRAPKDSVADTFSGGLISQLRREQMDIEQEYATKLNTYKPEWPAMQELKAKIDKGRQHVQKVIDEMVAKARDTARAEYQTALRREQSLSAELTKQKSQAMKLNSAAVEYNNLKVEVSTRRTLLDELLRKQSETGVANRLQGTRNSNVIVVDRALVPSAPYRPSLMRNAALGLVLGLMLGIAAVFAVELFDRTLHTPEDVERVLALPVLGVVPDVALAHAASYGGYGHSGPKPTAKTKGPRRLLPRGKPAAGAGAEDARIELIPVEHPRLAASESYRSARTALLLSTPGGLRSVVVTSAGPGEGKTATACNLAVVLAQLGREVLLVDSDLRKPRLHQVFKVSNRRGLVNFLTGTLEPGDAFQPTAVAGLSVTTAGATPPNPSELLASLAMRDFFKLAVERFDYVIFDSPPVVPVTDATILGTLTDGVILTLGAGMVHREDAVSALERLAVGQNRILGVVLNFFQPDRAGITRYQRYAAYGYGYGGDAPTPAPPEGPGGEVKAFAPK